MAWVQIIGAPSYASVITKRSATTWFNLMAYSSSSMAEELRDGIGNFDVGSISYPIDGVGIMYVE